MLNVAEDSDSDDEDIAAYKQQLRQINRNKFKKKLDSDLEEEAEEYDGKFKYFLKLINSSISFCLHCCYCIV